MLTGSARPVQPEDPSSSVSLVQGKMATFEPSQRQSASGVVPWSPPQVNWNPWTSSNIDEGPLAYVSLCSSGQAETGLILFMCYFLVIFSTCWVGGELSVC